MSTQRLFFSATSLSILGVALAGWSRPATAATYYVAPAPTGSDTAAGSQVAPWATLVRAQAAAAAGDTVLVRGGTYAFVAGTSRCASGTDTISAIALTRSGSAGNPIRYWAYPDERPVFDFSGIKDSCRVRGFDVSGSWLHLKGLEVKGVPQNNNLNHESWGVFVTGSNDTFEALDLHHNMGPGLFIQRGGNNLVLNCDSHHNYDPMTSNGAGESADGFGCHISAGDTGNVFRGCRAWWNSDDGFDFINAFAPVMVERSWAWYNGYLPDTMTSSGNGNGFKAGGYGSNPMDLPASAPQHTVRFCLAFLNKAAGVYANHHPVSSFFQNNTSYGNHPDFNMLGMSATGADINVGILRNNLAHGGTLLANEAGDDDAFNSWTLPVMVSDADFAGLSPVGMDGPRQADGSLPVLASFRLAPGSDLVDKGQDLGFPFAGTAPDLGAFETGLAGQGGSTGSTGGGGGAAGRGGPGTGGGPAGRSGGGTGGMPGTGGGPSNMGGSGAATVAGSGGAPSSGGGQGPAPSSTGGAPADGPGGASNAGGCHCQLDDRPFRPRTLALLAALGLAALGRSRRRR